jgi:hypothetical protein
MGGGTYSSSRRSVRADSLGYATRSRQEIFSQRSINNAMSPHGVVLRESRDSEEHPESLAIILDLDVTGSMGSVPHYLVKEGLPHIVEKIIESGIEHPQILFVAIGDHTCDEAPLQVGQFESSDELMDKWLTDVYLEGRGGGNEGESYMLAWYFAAYHTAIDCLEKRNKKGFLFTIGDEPVLNGISGDELKDIMGDGQYEAHASVDLLEKAMEKYRVYHIHVQETASGSRPHVLRGWRDLLSDAVLVANRHEDIADIIARKVAQDETQEPHRLIRIEEVA